MKKKKESTKGNFFQTIRGKVICMGVISLAASMILGIAGFQSLERSGKNNDVLAEINRINLYQYENTAQETAFLYFLENKYLEQIIKNLEQMQKYVKNAKNLSGRAFQDDFADMSQTITDTKDCYAQILEKGNVRGYVKDTGKYAVFFSENQQLEETLKIVCDDKWIDAKIMDITDELPEVSFDGRKFHTLSYNSKLEGFAKKDYLNIRISGTAVEFKGDIYLNNLCFYKEGKKIPYDMEAMTSKDISDSYGVAKNVEMKPFHGINSIYAAGNFTKANGVWEEVFLMFPIKEYTFQEYDQITYDLYVETGAKLTKDNMSTRCTPCGIYDMKGGLETLDKMVENYTKIVVEGGDVSKQTQEISVLFEEVLSACDNYILDKEAKEYVLSAVTKKYQTFQEINENDQEVIALKKDTIKLSERLTQISDHIKSEIEDNTHAEKVNLLLMITVIFIVTAVLIIFNTLRIAGSIKCSMDRFNRTLGAATEGNLSVRADVSGKDELAGFGNHLNILLDKLADVIHSVKEMAESLRKIGINFQGMADKSRENSRQIEMAIVGISEGAVQQAGKIESASSNIKDMVGAFKKITRNVEGLKKSSDQMGIVSSESSVFMKELEEANIKTAKAFTQVAEQIYKTNDSAKRIGSTTELITAIAEQTDLLSLNASIEAAKAGDSGKGFAVVATEIKKLAEQSSLSTDMIQKVIREVTTEAENTISIVNELKKVMNDQKEKLVKTQEHFSVLENNIYKSGRETDLIIDHTDACDDCRHKVQKMIEGLSEISEENVSFAEETSATMMEFDDTIQVLADESKQLLDLATNLEEQLRFFHV